MRSRFPLRSAAIAAIAFCVLIPAGATASDGAMGGTARGDVTCDGSVNSIDVQALLRRAADLETHVGCPASPSATTLFYTYPDEGTVAEDGSVFVSLFADVTGSLGAWSIDVRFDPDVLEAVNCTSAGASGCNILDPPGAVRFAGAVPTGLTGTQHFGDIEFRAVGNVGQSSELTLAVTAYDGGGDPLTGTLLEGSVQIVSSADPDPPANASYWPPADLNCDGDVDAIDALVLTEHISSPGSFPLEECSLPG